MNIATELLYFELTQRREFGFDSNVLFEFLRCEYEVIDKYDDVPLR
ncbi:hypothetical protein K7H99_20405 (plasmid) [Providencia rettgeri]|nr:hypothetical protein [Providencia rettgeri]QZY66582.1 hypothetical protein K7H99_20405 [Providencia rettgeri]